jgi:hypothetical protein
MKGGTTMPVTSPHSSPISQSVPINVSSPVTRRLLAVTLTLALTGVGVLAVPPAYAAPPAAVVTLSPPSSVPSVVHAPVSALASDTGCSTSGGTATCGLWAKAGNVTLASGAASVPVWTFVSASADPVTVAVGPTLVVTQGQTVDLVLHNQVPGEQMSLSMPQIDDFPEDVAGIASGTSSTYTFTAARPGTFLYEAGGTVDGARQSAMGLVGALVILPTAPGSAYGIPGTEYTDESVIVLSDVDPALNSAPATFDMRNFSPRYHLFNGQAFPSTSPIPVAVNSHALLRIVNGSIIQHGIGVLGAEQTVVATSARSLSHPYGIAAENVAAGDTMDLIVTVPPDEGMKYAVYDPSMRLDNDGAASSLATGNVVAFGGGLTFLQASGTAPTPASPPAVTALTVTPTRVGAPPTATAFSATVTDDLGVQAVEYLIDNASAAQGSGTNVPLPAGPAPSVSLNSISVPITSLATGTHQLLVRGRDADGWGPLQSAAFKVDATGPTVSAMTPASTAITGSAALAFTGSASDVGGGTIASATWSIDGGAGTPATVGSPSGSAAALSGSIPASVMTALTEGVHYLSGTATDDVGNAGAPGPAGTPTGTAFTVDRTAPTTGGVVVTPSPNNGTQGVAYDPTSIEVRAPYADAGSTATGVVSGEGFVGTAGATGTGFPMVINAATQTLVTTIPLSQLTSLPDGTTTIYVHAKDKAGNWGAVTSGPLVMNRAVSVSGLSLTPATTSTAATVALAGTANVAVGQTVGGAEYFVDTDPGIGMATAVTVGPPGPSAPISATVPVAGLTVGTHTLGVRARNSTGTWGPVTTVTLTLSSILTDGFESGGLPGAWTGPTTAGAGSLTRTAAAALVGSFGIAVSVTGTGNRAYLAAPASTGVPAYHVRLQVNPNTLATNGRWVSIFQAMGGATGTGPERFRIEYRRTGAGVSAVRLVVATGNGSTTSAAVGIGSAAASTIRVDWTSAASATVTLTVNGTPTALTGLNTNNRTVTSSRLGISLAPTNGAGAYGGVIYLDAFTSARYGF